MNRLRAAFEVLTQARERFYPVDVYLLDLCLLDPAMSAGVLKEPLETPDPHHVSGSRPRQSRIRPCTTRRPRPPYDKRSPTVGPTWWAARIPRPKIRSCPWNPSAGSSGAACEVYRAHLDDRNVETYARRRFGLYPQLPQIAKRFGFRYALHLGFDAGRFPLCAEPKRLWESPDGSNLETLMRPPLAADRPSHGWLLPWRLAATMKNDHVATLALLHWPLNVAPWYIDLRRMATYSPVLGRWTTLSDYLPPHRSALRDIPPRAGFLYHAVSFTGRGPEGSRPNLATDPASPAKGAVRGRGDDPRTGAGNWSVGPSLRRSPPIPAVVDDLPTLVNVEELVETGRYDEAATALRANPTRLVGGAGEPHSQRVDLGHDQPQDR